jgi:hypothetical protein
MGSSAARGAGYKEVSFLRFFFFLSKDEQQMGISLNFNEETNLCMYYLNYLLV